MTLHRLVNFVKLQEEPLTSKELAERICRMKKGENKSFCVQLNDENFQSYSSFQKFFDDVSDKSGIFFECRYTVKQKYIVVDVWVLP